MSKGLDFLKIFPSKSKGVSFFEVFIQTHSSWTFYNFFLDTSKIHGVDFLKIFSLNPPKPNDVVFFKIFPKLLQSPHAWII